MDAYKELKYNFDGIKNTIFNYSSKGIIYNDTLKLEKALEEDDLDAVKYFVEKLRVWYNENLGLILTNQFVQNKEDHRKANRFLKEIEPRIQMIDSLDTNNGNLDTSNIDSPPLNFFISHKSEDADFGNIIRQLLLNIGIKNNQIIFTSNPMNKIPFGEDIFDYLRQKITQNTYVIYLISDNYFNSSACLNEMGASWVMQADNAKLFLPDFNHNNPSYISSCVNPSKMGIVLDGNLHCKNGLVPMMEKIASLVNVDIEHADMYSFIDLTCEELKKLK